MSSNTTVSTTTIPTIQLQSRAYPADYDLHHSNTQSVSDLDDSSTESSSVGNLIPRNPEYWPDNYRRIPHYRPLNRNLDQSQRRVYTTFVERVFLTLMFHGLEVNVVSSSVIPFYPSVGDRILSVYS